MMKPFGIRHLFSWYGGLTLLLVLIVSLYGLTVYLPSTGESRRIDRITAEFKAHGCRSIHAERVPMFEDRPLLKHLELEKKVLRRLVFGTGAVVPERFLARPPRLPDLVDIVFQNADPSNEEFAWALGNPSLCGLALIGEHRIDQKGFRVLCERKNEIVLSFSDRTNVGEDLWNLFSCRECSLSVLRLSRCRLDDLAFRSLARSISLRELHLDDCVGCTAAGMNLLRNVPIRELSLRQSGDPTGELTEEMIRSIAGMAELEVLTVPAGSVMTSAGLDCLKSMPKLMKVRGFVPEQQDEMNEWIRLRIESTP